MQKNEVIKLKDNAMLYIIEDNIVKDNCIYVRPERTKHIIRVNIKQVQRLLDKDGYPRILNVENNNVYKGEYVGVASKGVVSKTVVQKNTLSITPIKKVDKNVS